MKSDLPAGTWVVAGALGVSGVVHLVRPQVFQPLIPKRLGNTRAWVYGSGAAELGCAVGLVTRQPWAPAATAATLGGIWIGNWTMAVRWQRSTRVLPARKAVAWARLPLQVPLIVWAWRSPTIRSAAPAPLGLRDDRQP